MIEDCLQTLREELYVAINKNDWNLTKTSNECEISRRELQRILYNQAKDIRLSTLVKISEGIGKPVSNFIK